MGVLCWALFYLFPAHSLVNFSCDSWKKSLWLWRRCGDKQVWKFASLRNGPINRFKCARSGSEHFTMPEVSQMYIPNTCSSISPGHRSWSITLLPMRYAHFLLWGGINLTHYAFKRSQRREFSAKRRYRWWLLHSNSVPAELAEVASSGPRGVKQTKLHFSIFLLGRARLTANSRSIRAGSRHLYLTLLPSLNSRLQ